MISYSSTNFTAPSSTINPQLLHTFEDESQSLPELEGLFGASLDDEPGSLYDHPFPNDFAPSGGNNFSLPGDNGFLAGYDQPMSSLTWWDPITEMEGSDSVPAPRGQLQNDAFLIAPQDFNNVPAALQQNGSTYNQPVISELAVPAAPATLPARNNKQMGNDKGQPTVPAGNKRGRGRPKGVKDSYKRREKGQGPMNKNERKAARAAAEQQRRGQEVRR